jgi:large subunit ribosomal protein L25
VGIATETLHASKRQARGTRACRSLRAAGQVPAVLYGLKEAALDIQVPTEELEEAIRRRSRMFELDLDKKKDVVLLKEVQYDAFGDDVVHADFMRIAMDEALTIEVPVQLKGVPKLEHAVLQQPLAKVEIECLPKDIPEAIIAQVADMVVGDTMKVSQLVVPPGVKILTDPDVIVATVTSIAEEVVAAAAPVVGEAASVEPEVIGRKAKEEGEEGEEAEGEEKK